MKKYRWTMTNFRTLLHAAAVGFLLAAPLATTGSASAATTTAGSCQTINLAVSLAAGQSRNQTVNGVLCTPYHWSDAHHQLNVLVAGATYNKTYWNWPTNYPNYSYTNDTLLAGRATFAYDNIGQGSSSHPLSTNITIATNAYVLHQVVQHYWTTHAYNKIDAVGHSMGSLISLDEASIYDDVNAVVSTGFIHNLNAVAVPTSVASLYPASLDTEFAGQGLDTGYLTTLPGTRQSLFYGSTADPNVIAYDEAHKDVVSGTEFGDMVTQIEALPADSLSTKIRVPVFEVIGGSDNIFCGTVNCNSSSQVRTHDAPYYPSSPSFNAVVIANTGHDVALHPSASASFAAINAWLQSH